MRPTSRILRQHQAIQNASFGLMTCRVLFAAAVLIFAAHAVEAIPLKEYRQQIRQAVTALDTLSQSSETESASSYYVRVADTIQGVRNLVPSTQTVEWERASFKVDNSWLHRELDKFKTVDYAERLPLLKRITERLQALEERLAEAETPGLGNTAGKAEEKRKLAEILQRSEYARKVKQESAVSRLMKEFLEWFLNLFPKPKPLSPGSAGLFSQIAQVFVVVLAVAVLAFVLRLFLPRLLRTRRSKKEKKAQPRIVLGEKLEPDQSAVDLLSEAEALARRGELRGAIRKAYIALLVELGDRKIISLAQHKTNRDYLYAVRNVQPLYKNVKQLTDSFELHWYGLGQATETDWLAFRSAYTQALQR